MRFIAFVIALVTFNCAAPSAQVKERAVPSDPPPLVITHDVRAINQALADKLLKFVEEVHTALEREESEGASVLIEINSIGTAAVDCCRAAGRFLEKALGKEVQRRGTKVAVEARWKGNFNSHAAWFGSFFTSPSWAMSDKNHYLVALQMTGEVLDLSCTNYNREIIALATLSRELTAGWCIRRREPICRESCTTSRISAGIGARVRVETAIAQLAAQQKQAGGGLAESANSVTLDGSGRDGVSSTSTWRGSGVPWHEVSEEYFAGPEKGLVCARICGLPEGEE